MTLYKISEEELYNFYNNNNKNITINNIKDFLKTKKVIRNTRTQRKINYMMYISKYDELQCIGFLFIIIIIILYYFILFNNKNKY